MAIHENQKSDYALYFIDILYQALGVEHYPDHKYIESDEDRKRKVEAMRSSIISCLSKELQENQEQNR